MNRAVRVLVLFAAPQISLAAAPFRLWLDEAGVGAVPPGWTVSKTGQGRPGLSAGGQFEHSLGGLGRQVIGDGQEGFFRGRADVANPFRGHAVAEQFLFRDMSQGQTGGSRSLRSLGLHIRRDNHLLDRLADFDQLGGAGLGMGL